MQQEIDTSAEEAQRGFFTRWLDERLQRIEDKIDSVRAEAIDRDNALRDEMANGLNSLRGETTNSISALRDETILRYKGGYLQDN